VKIARPRDTRFAVVESDVYLVSDNTILDFDMTLCKLVIPPYQYASLESGVKEEGDESLMGTLKRIAQVVNKAKSAPFWCSLSHEDKNKAFQGALETKTSVMLSCLTIDGTFSLTAIDINRDETIGIPVTFT
jgi:hypothetical protein